MPTPAQHAPSACCCDWRIKSRVTKSDLGRQQETIPVPQFHELPWSQDPARQSPCMVAEEVVAADCLPPSPCRLCFASSSPLDGGRRFRLERKSGGEQGGEVWKGEEWARQNKITSSHSSQEVRTLSWPTFLRAPQHRIHGTVRPEQQEEGKA